MPKLKALGENRFAFVAPECACERQEDLEEVEIMIAGREQEIARDELLYLVADCRGFLAAHNLLAVLALEENDIKLARGHFGFAYECGLEVLGPRFNGVLPSTEENNVEFFAAGRGLARCLIALGLRTEGEEVLQRLHRLDPDDADSKSLLDQLHDNEGDPSPSEAEPS